tara:strand:+ start:5119 stop:5412 length:294 start_codon:yes stop_codon:yes gene_type:complete
MNVQQISSSPEYITKFINHNFTKLIEIYDQGISENGCGVLSFKCSESENKMDVYFMNEEQILVNLQKESWENLKNSTDKKIFMVNDLDKNSIFLIYV